MSIQKRELNKDVINFNHLCKDLFRFIKKKIFNKYVNPDSISNNFEEKIENWKYYNSEEILTEEDKIYNIYKDNSFLIEVQICYQSLEKIISILDENRKNYEFMKKNIEVGEKKIKLLSELNSQLNQYFNSSNNNISLNQGQSNSNCSNNQKVLGHLSLMKSFNILNDLNIINSLKDLNDGENITNTNNSNNNIIKANSPLKGNHHSKKNLNKKGNNPNFLNKKREKNEKYIELNDQKTINAFNSFHHFNNKNENNTSSPKNNNNINNPESKTELLKDSSPQIQKDEINIIEQNTINSLIDKINVSQKIPPEKDNNNTGDIQINKENYINISKTENNSKPEISQKPNNGNIRNNGINTYNSNNANNKVNKTSNGKNVKCKGNAETEFEKILKNEFSSIYSNEKIIESNNDIIQEIKNILKKIPQLNFPYRQNKFENPYLIGTYKNIDTKYLLDALPAIDILFKCRDIKSIEEINSISIETMSKKLSLSYIEICKGYDKESEIVKVTNKCKIKVKENYFFIYINLFFVNVNISSFNDKELCINKYLFSNEIYSNKDKVLICLFFRRWRRKFKLFFIVPEFLDIIINCYYNDKDSISLIIENIFYDLINGEINFKGENIIFDDENTIKQLSGFIDEWFNIPEHKTELNNAIVATNEYLLKNDFLAVVKID